MGKKDNPRGLPANIGEEPKRYPWSTVIGTMAILIGVECIIFKAIFGDFVDADGVLHEQFFLLPIGFGLIFIGLVIFAVKGIRKMMLKRRR